MPTEDLATERVYKHKGQGLGVILLKFYFNVFFKTYMNVLTYMGTFTPNGSKIRELSL